MGPYLVCRLIAQHRGIVVKAKQQIKLTNWWKPLRPHRTQYELYTSTARFIMVPAGRRSGKTEIAKRKLVLSLFDCLQHPRPWADPRFFACAPTRKQAKDIWWNDLKQLVPKEWVEEIRETDLMIRCTWGAELHVIGLEKAERIE